MLIDVSIKSYIDKVASKEPTPGGGSVAALAGSLGSALTAMVGYLTIGRKMYEELDEKVKEEMDNNFDQLKKA